MNWKKKIYPETVTLRHWIMVAGFIVILAMTIWIFMAIKASSTVKSFNESDVDKKISRMATQHDVARIVSNTKQPQLVGKSPNAINKNAIAVSPVNYAISSAKALSGDELKAMQAPINQNQITDQSSNTQSMQSVPQPHVQSSSSNRTSGDQNLQGEKKDFLKENTHANPEDYLGATLQSPVSPYEIQAGTIIPGVLITGVDSDLPGQITGQVREDVYDSISGKYLLIPQGSKLIGIYDSQVAYGQTRVLVAWNRIIFPNGKSIDLKGMPGTDMSGYAGLHDQVNNHYMKIFGSVILVSILSAGGQLAQPQNQNSSIFSAANPTVGQTVAQSLGTNLANTGTMMTQKNLNIQPTLEIRQGYKFNITATKDMVFPGAYVEE